MESSVGVSLSFAQTGYTAVEADGNIELCVVIASGTLERIIDFTLSTMEGSALPSQDYAAQDFSLSFTPALDETCVTLSVADDEVVEEIEGFSLLLQTNDLSVDVERNALITIVDSSFVVLSFLQDEYNSAESETINVCVELEGQNDRIVTASIQVDDSSKYTQASYAESITIVLLNTITPPNIQ